MHSNSDLELWPLTTKAQFIHRWGQVTGCAKYEEIPPEQSVNFKTACVYG